MSNIQLLTIYQGVHITHSLYMCNNKSVKIEDLEDRSIQKLFHVVKINCRPNKNPQNFVLAQCLIPPNISPFFIQIPPVL